MKRTIGALLAIAAVCVFAGAGIQAEDDKAKEASVESLIGSAGAAAPVSDAKPEDPKPEPKPKPKPRPSAVNDEVIAKITKAMPKQATVKPARPRKLLVFTLCTGFRHSSIPVCAKMLEIMGKVTGAFEATVTDDVSFFEPAKLQEFDGVFMDNTTGELFGLRGRQGLDKLPAEEQDKQKRLRKSLLDFVSGGKGLAGSHAATDCSYAWKEYGEMIGGFFDGHPFGRIRVKVDDPAHPVNAAFGGKDFDFQDEIYTFRNPYSRKKQRVLLSIDAGKTDVKRGKRADKDYALSWVKDHGQGRVFYCAFGHRHEVFWDPAILRHYLDGIQFVLGDLKADATPSEK